MIKLATIVSALILICAPAMAHEGEFHHGFHHHGGFEGGYGFPIPVPRPYYDNYDNYDPSPNYRCWWRHHRRICVED